MGKAIDFKINSEYTIIYYTGTCKCSDCGKEIYFREKENNDVLIFCQRCNKCIEFEVE